MRRCPRNAAYFVDKNVFEGLLLARSRCQALRQRTAAAQKFKQEGDFDVERDLPPFRSPHAAAVHRRIALRCFGCTWDGHCAGGGSRRRGQPVGGNRRDGHEPGARLRRHAIGGHELRRRPAAEAHFQQPGGHPEFGADDQSRRRRRRGRGQCVHQRPAFGRSISVHAAHVRRHAGVQLVRSELLGVRRLLSQRPRHRAAGVRARRRFESVRARFRRRPHQLHLQDRQRHAREESAAGSCGREPRAQRLRIERAVEH